MNDDHFASGTEYDVRIFIITQKSVMLRIKIIRTNEFQFGIHDRSFGVHCPPFSCTVRKKIPTNGCQFIFRFSMFNVSMYSDYARE